MRGTLLPAIQPVRQRAGREGGSDHRRSSIRPPGLTVSGGGYGGNCCKTIPPASSQPYQSYRRLCNRVPQRHLRAPVDRRTLQTWWGLRRSVPGLWCRVDPSWGQVAGGPVGRRRGSGSPATAFGGGGAGWSGFFFSPSRGGGLAVKRTDTDEKKAAVVQDSRPAEGRVTPSWTAGRRKTGSPDAFLDGRPVGDRVAARRRAPEATSGRRRTG